MKNYSNKINEAIIPDNLAVFQLAELLGNVLTNEYARSQDFERIRDELKEQKYQFIPTIVEDALKTMTHPVEMMDFITSLRNDAIVFLKDQEDLIDPEYIMYASIFNESFLREKKVEEPWFRKLVVAYAVFNAGKKYFDKNLDFMVKTLNLDEGMEFLKIAQKVAEVYL